MSDFIPGGPEIPAPPFEIPTPDLPTANFTDIGAQIGEGLKKGGLFDSVLQNLLDGIAAIVAKVLAALLSLLLDVVARILQYVFQVLEGAQGGMDRLAATIVGGVTGISVSAGQFSSPVDRGARESIATSMVTTLQTAMAAGQGAGADGGLQPSSQGAETFLKFTTHMAIEGWLLGMVADAISVHEFEKVSELKEDLERALGLSRLARRAFAAPMKILVEDPYTWKLHQTYRPAIPSESVLVREYLRNPDQRATLDKYAGYLGHSPANVDALINFYRAHLSPGDIETLRLHGQLDDNTATAQLKALGYDDATAASVQIALAAGRHDTWARLLVQEALNGLTTRQITPADFDQYLNNSGLPADEKSILTLYANLKLQFATRRFTISEGEQLVKKGLWSLDQFRTLALELGYTDQDETVLELLLLGEIKDAADATAKKKATAEAKAAAAQAKAEAAKQKAANATAAAEAKGVSVAKFETLVEDGLKTIDQYQTFLAGKGIAADNIDAMTGVLQGKLSKAAAAAAAQPGLVAGAKAKNLDLAQLQTAALDGVITVDEFQSKLQEIGFKPEDIALLASVLNDKLAAAKVKADTKAAALAKARSKRVDLAQEQRGVRLGLVTIAQYSAFLDQLGFAADDRDLLVGEMQAQLTADQQARQTKASVQVALQQKGLSLTQLDQAVRAGVATIDDYRAALAKAGYNVQAQDQLVSLLQLRMQTDQQVLAAKGKAAALLGQVGVSLADLERAVKLGVVPITVYSDQLAKSGVSSDNAKLLTLSLAAQVKATKVANNTKAAVSKQLSAAGLSLTTLEKDVLAGRLTSAQLGGVLAGAGISSADQQTILSLIDDEVANQKALADLEGKATAAAATKGLSLTQEQEAVKQGVKTIDDYQTFVTALNFAPADVATLVATLAAKLKLTAPAPITPTGP